MSDALTVIAPRSLVEAKELATTLSQARSIPDALQKSPADVLAIVMAGAELGLAPMQSIRALVLIKGKPTLSADAMGALVKSSPLCLYLQCTESTAKVATFKTQRKGDPEPTMLSFTIEEAQQAGLNGDNWKKFPKAMLRARAQSAICRLVYSDLLLGVYDPDEIEPVEKEVNRPPAEASKPDGVEAMKRRMRVVENGVEVARAPKPSPPVASSPEDETAVGWGKNAALRLVDLTTDKVQWYLDDAKKKATDNADDERELWESRARRYGAEIERRISESPAAEPGSAG